MANVAVLIGSELRGLDQFISQMDDLFVGSLKYDVFISTDNRSMECVAFHGLFALQQHVRWIGNVGDTDSMVRQALHLTAAVPIAHLHQFWRLQHAWGAMQRHESKRGKEYRHVMRIRTDLYLPRPIDLMPSWVPELHGENASVSLVMRGDWIFWGRREAMQVMMEFVKALPWMHAVGQQHYMPMPWRHILAVGVKGLAAGMFTWINFPKRSARLPFGFDNANSIEAIVKHIKNHLTELEEFEASRHSAHLQPHELTSGREGWWRWNLTPDPEKYLFYFVLSRSLFPRISFIELYNRQALASTRVSLGSLLLKSRHHRNCTCICKV
ncbi:hypothetical protein AB1Y20_015229 [Prymnesium parvum]|uniref:Protein xylosyltransferase n=1 Tax=Prymnesium parvum TaxID=97485 RepID=A0AB34JXU4_PRYPA